MWQPPHGHHDAINVNGRTFYASYDAYFGFRDEANSSPRDSRQNNHVQCDQSENPLTLPAPRSPASQPARTENPPPIAPNSYAQPLPVNMYLCPPQQKRDRSSSKDKDRNARNSNRMPQPPQTFFAGLPPPAFPMQPVPGAAYPMPPFPQPQPFSIPSQPFPAAAPGAFPATMPLQNQIAGPPNLPPQRVVAEGDLRYKCEVCGRFRSTRYHYKHPIPPGQLPAKTVCQRCRDEATDSEEDTSSESSQSARRQHRARHDRSRNASSHRQWRHSSRNRARSGRRPQLLDNGRARYTEQYYSDSTSSSSPERRYKDRDGRTRRPRSIHEEVVRHTRRLRLSPVEQRRIHFEDERREGRRHTDEESESDVYEETRRRVRSSSRAQTPVPRARRQEQHIPSIAPSHANTFIAGPHPYFPGPPPGSNGRAYSPQRGRALSQGLVPHPTQHQAFGYPSSQAEEDHQYSRYHSKDRGRRRSRSRSSYGPGENEDRRAGHHQTHIMAVRGQDTFQPRAHCNESRPQDRHRREEHEHRLYPAPSPPLIRSSSMGYLAKPDSDEDERHETRSGRRHRRRSRSRTWEYEGAGSTLVRPGDELTIIERHESRPRGEDYHWYDDEGMRVRVREI